MFRVRVLVCLVVVALAPAAARAQQGDAPRVEFRTGREVYDAACAACHGADGRGMPQATVGFDVPLPDFSDCLFATVEAAEGWEAVVHEGGPVRALDRHMPAFGRLLSRDEIRLAVSHVRTFCDEHRRWPQGDLNFPRPLITEKAFPENEAVLTSSVGRGPSRAVSTAAVYERRFGARNMFEVNVPFDAQRADTGQWAHGLGDVAVALKRAVYHDDGRGTIFSLGEEVGLPTGKESQGLGSGVTTFETFAAFGQRLPHESFLQLHAGAGFPTKPDVVAREAFWRIAAGKTFTQGGFHRQFSPMVELVAARELQSGAATEWDIVPQMQISLSKRRHVLLAGGVQLPLNEREGRHAQVLSYLIWDWYEGGFLDGWK